MVRYPAVSGLNKDKALNDFNTHVFTKICMIDEKDDEEVVMCVWYTGVRERDEEERWKEGERVEKRNRSLPAY